MEPAAADDSEFLGLSMSVVRQDDGFVIKCKSGLGPAIGRRKIAAVNGGEESPLKLRKRLERQQQD